MADIMNNGKPAGQTATASGLTEGLANVGSSITNAATSIKNAATAATSGFGSAAEVGSSTDFLNSNSLLAKFTFLILAVIVFLFLLNLGVSLVYYFTTPQRAPYLIWGMKSGTDYTVIAQDSGKMVTYRSNNQPGGAEFTWSAWLKIDSIPADYTYHPIFVKGNDTYDNLGIATVNNGPGLYLVKEQDSFSGQPANGLTTSVHATLHYVMDVVSPINGAQMTTKQANIPNIPIGKWFHVAIRLQNKALDCYVNGTITTRVSFDDYIPKQNYDNVVYAGNGGFSGSISNLRYYDRALSVFELNSIVYYGPNTSAASASSSYTGYLGRPWYTASSST